MIDCYRRRRPWPAALIAACLLLPAASARTAPDDGFAPRHPRLFFSEGELPAWRARVHDGGADDVAYAYIRQQATTTYTTIPLDSLVSDDAAQEPIINLALASHFETDVDSTLVNLGRRVTLYIARNWDVDTDAFGSSLRLRALAIGFDHFFVNATAAERNEIRSEANSYISYMTTNMNYDIWRWRPYVSNKSAMIAGALGLAGICFQDELPASTTGAALARADELFRDWRDAQLANDGCYREGSLYAAWSLRNLIYYFDARKRFDDFDYALDPMLRAVERWMPYEVDPRGDACVNNIQDVTNYFHPLARHTTYWAWAQSEWGSRLAAYMWDHSAGTYGVDMLDENDKASTVLWHRNLAPLNPGAVLPRSHVWEDRGLYYFRTGWPDGAASDDVVFSFYSGAFQGGHAQEDQNQFTLAAYGEKLVLDNATGGMGKQSEAHNLVFIDGKGQYNAGSSIGTDGKITDYVTTDYADCVTGDATSAYSTHSPYNNAGVPYAWSDWSWGFSGANPVEHAWRTVLAAHGPGVAPYFVIRDDVKKDASTHQYDWRLHLPASASVDTTGETITVTSGNATLRLYCIEPVRTRLQTLLAPFDNGNEDPDSRVLTLRSTATEANFTLLLLPLPMTSSAPATTCTTLPDGAEFTLDWGNEVVDVIVMRVLDAPVRAFADGPQAADPFPWKIATDAPLALVRKNGPSVTGFTMVNGTWLSVGDVVIAASDDAPVSMVFDGANAHISRADAAFRVRSGLAGGVYYRGAELTTHTEGEYLVRTLTTGAGVAVPRALRLCAYPNPFNPSVRIAFVNPSRGAVSATVHDVAGHRVATLAARVMEAGAHELQWDGRNESGESVGSGVYFVRLHAGAFSAKAKLVLVR